MSAGVAVPPAAPASTLNTVADLLRRLGDIPPSRVRLRPPPGTATEADVLTAERTEHVLCELVEGTLVEKGMGYRESMLAAFLIQLLNQFVQPQNLGIVTGPDGTLLLMTGLVRIPDVAFTGWARFPGRRLPIEPIPHLVPDLAIEVLSRSNTPGEMGRKRQEYFTAGVVLVWEVDPETRTVTVYTAPNRFTQRTEADTLDGGAVLPGFTLALRDLFGELDRQG